MPRAKILPILLVLTALCGLTVLLVGSFFTLTSAETETAALLQSEDANPRILAAKVQMAQVDLQPKQGRSLYGGNNIGYYREDTPMPVLVHEYVPYEEQLFALINAEREKAELPPLELSPELAMSASRHSADMAANNYFGHTNLNGVNFADRILKTGFTFSAAGENLYAGNGPYNSPENAVTSWMNSPEHRANILSPDFTYIGLGYRFNSKSTYGGYYTADFGKP